MVNFFLEKTAPFNDMICNCLQESSRALHMGYLGRFAHAHAHSGIVCDWPYFDGRLWNSVMMPVGKEYHIFHGPFQIHIKIVISGLVLSLGCFIFKTKLSQLWLYNVITVL
jgi:hypothetical protein